MVHSNGWNDASDIYREENLYDSEASIGLTTFGERDYLRLVRDFGTWPEFPLIVREIPYPSSASTCSIRPTRCTARYTLAGPFYSPLLWIVTL